MAAFHSCLTVASCTTIPARIKHNPATKDIKSSSDMK
jgi:starvation-inducible outer membrane lipoprotein